MSWARKFEQIGETLSNPHFWWTLLGVLAALAVWFYLFWLAIRYLDTSLAMHSTFCSSDSERNWHILIITLLTPLFLVGLLGVIGEWMHFVENRRRKRKTKFKPLIVFMVLMQVTTLFILIALEC